MRAEYTAKQHGRNMGCRGGFRGGGRVMPSRFLGGALYVLTREVVGMLGNSVGHDKSC